MSAERERYRSFATHDAPERSVSPVLTGADGLCVRYFRWLPNGASSASSRHALAAQRSKPGFPSFSTARNVHLGSAPRPRYSTPHESGLGWTVNLDRDPFIGQAALRAEKQRGPARRFVGLEIDWGEYETLFEKHRLPPEICTAAWRDPVPVYAPKGRQVGQATSGAWSPTLKKNLALATVAATHAEVGRELSIEVTVEFARHRVKATVARKPFFDVPRKREVIACS